MKKLIICLLLSSLLLTGCLSKNEKTVVNNNDKVVTENSKDNKTDTTTNNQNTNNDSSKDTPLDGIDSKVKEYILNGQGDKPEADKLLWSKTFLNKVDFQKMYNSYIKDGGTAGDVEWFAKYITLYAPKQSDWEEMFKKDVLDAYNEKIVSIKYLEGDLYQGNVIIDGVEKAYVAVNARTGYYHGTSDSDTPKVAAKVQLYEGIYFDSRRCGDQPINPYNEIKISNITDTSFDFTVYEVKYTDLPNSDKVERTEIFLTNTAEFIEDGTKAAFYGNDYTLYFTFPDNHKALPIVTDIQVKGFKPLEGNTYLNNSIPGHEFN